MKTTMLSAYLLIFLILNAWFTHVFTEYFEVPLVEAIGWSLNTPFRVMFPPDGLEYLCGSLIPGSIATAAAWGVSVWRAYRKADGSILEGVVILSGLAGVSTIGFLMALP